MKSVVQGVRSPNLSRFCYFLFWNLNSQFLDWRWLWSARITSTSLLLRCQNDIGPYEFHTVDFHKWFQCVQKMNICLWTLNPRGTFAVIGIAVLSNSFLYKKCPKHLTSFSGSLNDFGFQSSHFKRILVHPAGQPELNSFLFPDVLFCEY